MKHKFVNLLIFLSLFAAFTINIAAQSSAKSTSFLLGETLSYEGKVSKIIQGIAVADLTFTFTNSPNGKDYLIKTDAKSKGSLLKLFRYSFLQQYESTVEKENLRVLKTVKHDEQKERVRDSQAVFDYDGKQVTFSETNPKEAARPPRKIASELKGDTYDMVSAIYALRTFPLAVGNIYNLSISDSGLIYKVPVRVTKREIQKTVVGKVMCFRIEPEVFGNNRLIEQDGSMIIWITDDARRLPVRSQINTEKFKVEVKLKQMKYLSNVPPKN